MKRDATGDLTGDAARGRPLRFLATVLFGWIGLRVVLLWPPRDAPDELLRAIAPVAVAEADPAPTVVRPLGSPTVAHRAVPAAVSHASVATARHAPDPIRLALAPPRYGDDRRREDAPLLPGLPRAFPVTAPATTPPPPPSRWSGSFWLVARAGSGIAPGVLGGQLGGSQTGARLAYTLDRTHRVALAARVTTPLGAGLREAALGVEWQPTRLPVRLVAEERFALDGGKSGPAIGMVGGFGPIGMPNGFRLEGYGQAGAIRRTDTEAYADGAVRMAHTLARIGGARIELGAGAWGAAQRGAARLDLGPSLGLTVPLGKQSVRLTLDWRQRIVGEARPGSGPALTLGSDF